LRSPHTSKWISCYYNAASRAATRKTRPHRLFGGIIPHIAAHGLWPSSTAFDFNSRIRANGAFGRQRWQLTFGMIEAIVANG
jgi:hypothetical protein